MYRSSPHTTTGVSPAEHLFGQNIRTKIPDLDMYTYSDKDQVVRERDSEQNEKGKVHSDAKRRAKVLALMKQNKENKLATTYYPEPLKVLKKTRNSVLMESQEGAKYKKMLHM